MNPRRQSAWVWRLVAWSVSAVILTLVFLLYTRADFLRPLADLLWSCF